MRETHNVRGSFWRLCAMQRNRSRFCLRAEGDSMVGARIYDDDIVFIHQQPEVENGEIAAVSINDSVTLKRVYIDDDCIELRTENPRVKPLRYKISDFNQFRILGKAIAFQDDIV
nr:S24 family peptidase [Phascolarctobacterium faecium]